MTVFDRIITSARRQGCDWTPLQGWTCPSCRTLVGSLHMTRPADGQLRIRCLTCILRVEAGLPVRRRRVAVSEEVVP